MYVSPTDVSSIEYAVLLATHFQGAFNVTTDDEWEAEVSMFRYLQ